MPLACGLRVITSSSCDLRTTRLPNATDTTASSSNSSMLAARSRIVRAGEVTGIPLRQRMS